MNNEALEIDQQAGAGEMSALAPEPHDILSPSSGSPEILNNSDREKHARSLSDQELITKMQSVFRDWRHSLPYLREARDRFAKPGQRVPIPGNPTWTEWVERNLGVNIRTVQRTLAEPKEPQLPTPKHAKQPAVALTGLSEQEREKLVERAKVMGPDVASHIMYRAVVHEKGDLEPVREAVKRCLDGLGKGRQLETLQELQQWVTSQVDDLLEELTAAPSAGRRLEWVQVEEIPPAQPATIIEQMVQQNAAEAACV
jgi:hypothetical protein